MDDFWQVVITAFENSATTIVAVGDVGIGDRAAGV